MFDLLILEPVRPLPAVPVDRFNSFRRKPIGPFPPGNLGEYSPFGGQPVVNRRTYYRTGCCPLTIGIMVLVQYPHRLYRTIMQVPGILLPREKAPYIYRPQLFFRMPVSNPMCQGPANTGSTQPMASSDKPDKPFSLMIRRALSGCFSPIRFKTWVA
jgi:hypothetical protein